MVTILFKAAYSTNTLMLHRCDIFTHILILPSRYMYKIDPIYCKTTCVSFAYKGLDYSSNSAITMADDQLSSNSNVAHTLTKCTYLYLLLFLPIEYRYAKLQPLYGYFKNPI